MSFLTFQQKRDIINDPTVRSHLNLLLSGMLSPPGQSNRAGQIDDVGTSDFIICFDGFDELLEKIRAEVVETITQDSDTFGFVAALSELGLRLTEIRNQADHVVRAR